MIQRKKRPLNWPLPIAVTLLTYVIFRTLLFWGYVPSASMEPTLAAGSCILGTRVVGELKTGDIIVFRHDGQLLVKRIAASPGEQIDPNDLACMSSEAQSMGTESHITVPDGCYFVLGDNRRDSVDSRHWSDPFVREADVIAKIFT